jgi:hypothetical protein
MRDVIVEGPDGGGKTSLVRFLHETLGLPMPSRSSTSTGGPIPNLADWIKDQAIWPKGSIPHSRLYDRHPIISEPIYGRLVRPGSQVQAPLDDDRYQRDVRAYLYEHAVVVWALPNLATVHANVLDSRDDQMPGVVANIGRVHQAYMTAYFRWRGIKRQYDYNRHDRDLLAKDLLELIR